MYMCLYNNKCAYRCVLVFLQYIDRDVCTAHMYRDLCMLYILTYAHVSIGTVLQIDVYTYNYMCMLCHMYIDICLTSQVHI